MKEMNSTINYWDDRVPYGGGTRQSVVTLGYHVLKVGRIDIPVVGDSLVDCPAADSRIVEQPTHEDRLRYYLYGFVLVVSKILD